MKSWLVILLPSPPLFPAVFKRVKTQRMRGFAVLVAFVLLFVLTVPSYAWDADVHYGLTFWLAIKAGFSRGDAQIIASGNQRIDEGGYNPATWDVALHVVPMGDVGASRAVQRLHFPSYGPVPGDPKVRAVERGSVAAEEWVKHEIETPINGKPARRALEDFGEGLHAFQDSWSHRGVPDIPFFPFGPPVRPEISWGHPQDRHGWYLHDADITSVFPDDAREMAKATYEVLKEYLRRHSALRKGPAEDWGAIEGKVDAFAKATTKEQKLKWFDSDRKVPFSQYGNLHFLDSINVPDGLWRRAKIVAGQTATFIATVVSPSDDIREVQRIANEFLTRWILERDIALESVSMESIRRQLEPLALSSEAAQSWVRKVLTMWLIEDHGLVNQRGHGDPRREGYGELPSDPREASGTFRVREYARLGDAIQGPDAGTLYKIAPVDPQILGTGPAYAVFFRFRDLPKDVLIIVIAREGSSWRIVRILWAIPT